ncbi:hypothetical protein KFK14_18630 [Sphingobium phenoxybenzoativorans]|uniref:Uncharacterized protein n=1 Tax=Sphingobium phenoxybenzoativorans TaxID=1592790 RepID=A0A975K622_9SPHN|nr:hypothetical protein [Sphingobium phenoxybenzoativorans]QUT05014.1 hypothetical protein KFK14_18630 [Sphingobium phenoxybenzoativorans]
MRDNQRGNEIRVKQEQSISPERKKAPERGLLRVITDMDMELADIRMPALQPARRRD